MGSQQWHNWRRQHPHQLDELHDLIRQRLVNDLVIDANLDELVRDEFIKIRQPVDE